MDKSSALELLISDFGYDPVDIESNADYIRALKESFNKLQIENPSDPRLITLADAIKGFRRAKSTKEAAKSGGKSRAAKRRKPKLSEAEVKAQIDAKEKKKKDAMNFISPGSALAPVAPAGDEGGGDMSGALMKISNDVNIIKGIVAAENKIEEDKADDTREAREKKKRGMRENLLEGGKKVFGAVKKGFGKVLEPAKGIFTKIFDFLKLFILGSGLMMLLDWFGDPANKDKINSIFKFLKDWWPVLVAGLMAMFPGVALIPGLIALTIGFLPKLIDTVKMLFGFGKQVDDEIKKNEKDLEKEGSGDTTFKVDKTLPSDPESEKPPEATPTIQGGGTEGENLQQPKPFNQGGEVPGSGNTDTVPAMLTPGEFVLTKDAVKQYGVDSLYAMNAAAGGVGKSNDVPRGPDGKPMKKKSKPKMKTSTVGTMMNMGGFVDNFAMDDYHQTFGNVYMNRGGIVQRGDVQHMFLGGMVKKAGNLLSKTPQARLLKFAGNQIKKLPVPPPISKVFKSLSTLGSVPAPQPTGGVAPPSEGDEIPSFDVLAPGGLAKEQTLGIRR